MTAILSPAFRPAALALASAATFAAVVPANGALLVYEGFADYSTSGVLFGQPVSGSATGLSGTWSGNAASQSAGNISASSLSFGSSLATSGGSYVNTNSTVVIGATVALTSPYSGTLWSSHLIRFNGAHATGSGNGVELRIGESAGGADSVRFRSFSDTRSGTSNVIGADYNTTDLSNIGDSADPALATSTTYLMISSFTNVGSTTGSGTATTWAFTAAQFQTMISSPLGVDAYLAGATVGQYTAKATNTDTAKLTDLLETGDFMQFVNVGNNVQLDEIRFGEELADVIPVVPEPSSSTLGIAAAALLLFRRKR